MAKRQKDRERLWVGKDKWKGFKLECWKGRGAAYYILNLTKPKHVSTPRIMVSPNVIRLAYHFSRVKQ